MDWSVGNLWTPIHGGGPRTGGQCFQVSHKYISFLSYKNWDLTCVCLFGFCVVSDQTARWILFILSWGGRRGGGGSGEYTSHWLPFWRGYTCHYDTDQYVIFFHFRQARNFCRADRTSINPWLIRLWNPSLWIKGCQATQAIWCIKPHLTFTGECAERLAVEVWSSKPCLSDKLHKFSKLF